MGGGYPMDADKHMAKVPILIRARSVVQVHPGPPFKSHQYIRGDSHFPLPGDLSSKNRLAKNLPKVGMVRH
jgi:hypothetical protein